MRARSFIIALFIVASPAAAQSAKACTPVAARQLARGTVLTADDIAEPKGSALCALRSALVGWTTRRVMLPGEALREPAIAAPNVIEYGQSVAVVYRDGGIEIRLKGVAANAAPVGGRVTVRIDARRRLDGVAAAPGVVDVK